MTEPLVLRQLLLALAALAAVAAGLAVLALTRDGGQASALPSTPVPEAGWYAALAAPYRIDTAAELTACGQPARETTPGVAHPVLPCGAKVVIRLGDREVLTQVVDRGSGRPGREFELTTALAAEVGLRGVEPIRWRFARRG